MFKYDINYIATVVTLLPSFGSLLLLYSQTKHNAAKSQ